MVLPRYNIMMMMMIIYATVGSIT